MKHKLKEHDSFEYLLNKKHLHWIYNQRVQIIMKSHPLDALTISQNSNLGHVWTICMYNKKHAKED